MMGHINWGRVLLGGPLPGSSSTWVSSFCTVSCEAKFIPNAGHLWILDHMNRALSALIPDAPGESA